MNRLSINALEEKGNSGTIEREERKTVDLIQLITIFTIFEREKEIYGNDALLFVRLNQLDE
jgi:hypothetical protein